MSPVIISNIKPLEYVSEAKSTTEVSNADTDTIKIKQIIPLSRLNKKVLPYDDKLGQTR